MNVLVINTGSSSIKFSIFSCTTDRSKHPNEPPLLDGEVKGIGSPHAELSIQRSKLPDLSPGSQSLKADAVPDALQQVFALVKDRALPTVEAVGYRVVHPGPHLDRHQRITPQVLQELRAAASFAPLHDPVALQAIDEGMRQFPGIPHVACFDTVFHQTMPPEASIYPIPANLRALGLRRYGFHGLSCESIVREMRLSGAPVPQKMVIAHLGSGCSVTALRDGVSIANTMGLTPTGGVVMGTRPGDLDPGLLLYLMRQQQGNAHAAAQELEGLLNSHSGLVALSGMPNNVRDLRAAANEGNADAVLALQVFTRSVVMAMGSFCWLLGGLNAIIFAGGIGENDPQTRADILRGLGSVGVTFDTDANAVAGKNARRIDSPQSQTAVFIVPAQEDLMIALHVQELAGPSTIA